MHPVTAGLKQELFHRHKEAQQCCRPHNLPLLRAAQQREMEVRWWQGSQAGHGMGRVPGAGCAHSPSAAGAASQEHRGMSRGCNQSPQCSLGGPRA